MVRTPVRAPRANAVAKLHGVDEGQQRVAKHLVDAGADIGEIQRLGDTWSLFFRDVDGMELEVCAPGDE